MSPTKELTEESYKKLLKIMAQ